MKVKQLANWCRYLCARDGDEVFVACGGKLFKMAILDVSENRIIIHTAPESEKLAPDCKVDCTPPKKTRRKTR